MIIFWPVDYVDTTERISEEWVSDGRPINVPCFKRCRRNLHINTDLLAPRDKLWVDIALKRQNILDDPRYFILLRNLFNEEDPPTTSFNAFSTVMYMEYYENSSGEQISTAEFIAELYGTGPLAILPNRMIVPADLSEEQARASRIPEITPMHSSDFAFTTQDIETLNRFVESTNDLCNSSLCRQPNAMTLNISYEVLGKNVTREQYIASLVAFRKLYADKEPAGFKRAVRILQNTNKVRHPLVYAINNADKQYEDLLKQKLTANSFIGHFTKNLLHGEWSPTGREMIKVMFNVNSIHQGDKDTYLLEQRIRNAIPSDAIVVFSLWQLLVQLCRPIIITANYARCALHALGQLQVNSKLPDITNKELEFKFFLTKQIPILAEIIWRERRCPESGVVEYLGEAERQIIEKFHLPQNYFSDISSSSV